MYYTYNLYNQHSAHAIKRIILSSTARHLIFIILKCTVLFLNFFFFWHSLYTITYDETNFYINYCFHSRVNNAG